jgi:hypothetical protein
MVGQDTGAWDDTLTSSLFSSLIFISISFADDIVYIAVGGIPGNHLQLGRCSIIYRFGLVFSSRCRGF